MKNKLRCHLIGRFLNRNLNIVISKSKITTFITKSNITIIIFIIIISSSNISIIKRNGIFIIVNILISHFPFLSILPFSYYHIIPPLYFLYMIFPYLILSSLQVPQSQLSAPMTQPPVHSPPITPCHPVTTLSTCTRPPTRRQAGRGYRPVGESQQTPTDRPSSTRRLPGKLPSSFTP